MKDPGSWDRMWSLYHQALDQPTLCRVEWVQSTCPDGPLRDHVLDLLHASDEAADFLSEAPRLPFARQPDVGDRLGNYLLERRLGEGGMGIVYEATQRGPLHRRVALKLIRPGLGTPEALLRFDAERQALARMNHPHIAKVFDAGVTPTGCPYFVMERVHGLPLTTYCDRHRLSVRERLELLTAVLDAVQHAHYQGVMHRDIKPGNILVEERDGRPCPKIIDFGLAKALDRPLTAQTLATTRGQLLGTPEYMSPEQAAAAPDIDTRTDVYALGVVAYRVLCGTLPGNASAARGASPSDVHDRLQQVDTVKPSEQVRRQPALARAWAAERGVDATILRRQLANDVDWIVMKAVEKDRAQRYATVSEFAEDIHRHLRLEPILAGPPTLRYRLRRFCLRHRLAVGIAAILVTGLTVGLAGIASGRDRAEQALDQARAEHARARHINAILEDVIASATPEIAQGRDTTILCDILEAAKDRAAQAASERPLVGAHVFHTLATTYRSLGRPDDASETAEAAVRLLRTHLGGDDPETLRCMATLALIRRDQGRLEDSLELGQATLSRQIHQLGRRHPETLTTMNNVALALKQTARYEEALQLFEEVVALRQAVLGPTDRLTLISANNLAAVLESLGRLEEAAAHMRGVLAHHLETYGPEDPDTLISMDVLGRLTSNLGHFEDAAELHRRALAGSRQVFGADHPDTLAAQKHLADALTHLGQFEEAERLLRQTLASLSESLGADHRYALYTRHALGRCLAAAGRQRDAHHILVETRAVAVVAFPDAHTFRARLDLSLAELLFELDQPEAARDLALRVVDVGHARFTVPAKALLQRLPTLERDRTSAREQQLLAVVPR